MNTPVKIAVLVSGGGTNFQALIDEEKRLKVKDGFCPYTICAAVSSTKDAFAVERAKNAGIPCEIASPFSVMGAERARTAGMEEKRLAVSDAVLKLCRSYGAEAVVLAGFLTILRGSIISEYAGRIINLHPALLPKFGGEGMWGHHVHEAVLAAGEKESGCTVHLVDSGCDTGTILVQKKVPVLSGDTVESLYKRIAPMEHEAMKEAVLKLAAMIRT